MEGYKFSNIQSTGAFSQLYIQSTGKIEIFFSMSFDANPFLQSPSVHMMKKSNITTQNKVIISIFLGTQESWKSFSQKIKKG